MSSTFRVLSCLTLLLCTGSVSAQTLLPDFDQGVNVTNTIENLKSSSIELASPAAKATERQVFQYKVPHYPKGDGNCIAAAQRIGAAVEKIGQVKLVSSVCENADESGFKIAVSYEALEQLTPVSTVGLGYYEGGFGNYPSEQACTAELAKESQAFRDATGLEPVVSYCFKGTKSTDKFWSIRIDSFGQAKLLPDNRSALVFTLPYMPQQQFLGQIKDRLAEQGVNIRFVSWIPDFMYASLTASYYATSRIGFKLEEVAKLDSKEQCEAMLSETNKVLTPRSPAPLIAYCGKTSMSDNEVTWLFKDKASLKIVKTSEGFKGYTACMAGRERTAEYYRTSMGHPVAAALCSRDVLDYNWKVILLED